MQVGALALALVLSVGPITVI